RLAGWPRCTGHPGGIPPGSGGVRRWGRTGRLGAHGPVRGRRATLAAGPLEVDAAGSGAVLAGQAQVVLHGAGDPLPLPKPRLFPDGGGHADGPGSPRYHHVPPGPPPRGAPGPPLPPRPPHPPPAGPPAAPPL